MAIRLEVEAGAGSVLNICKEMVRLSVRMDIGIQCSVNGVWILASPNDKPVLLCERFKRDIGLKQGIK